MEKVTTLFDRLGVISHIVKKKPGIGSTALMKCLYIAQEVFDVPLGYDYRMYTYGPYCGQVVADTEIADTLDYIKIKKEVQYSADKTNIICRRKTSTAGVDNDKASMDLVNKHENAINEAIKNFAHKPVRELGLVATIVFVINYFKDKGQKQDKAEIIKTVKDLKPHFEDTEINSQYDYLVETFAKMAV